MGEGAKIGRHKKKRDEDKRRNWKTLVLLRVDEEGNKKFKEDRNPVIRVNVTLNPSRTRLPDSLEPEWNKINTRRLSDRHYTYTHARCIFNCGMRRTSESRAFCVALN